jgi:hypothetical protein
MRGFRVGGSGTGVMLHPFRSEKEALTPTLPASGARES